MIPGPDTQSTRPGIPFVIAILLIVFLAGYLVMALEILAFRIIQVNFGSDIFSTGAVLSVVLAALTLGYWVGGSLSVKIRPTRIQATSLIIAGLWIFLLAGIPNPVGNIFQPRENPQIISQPYIEAPWKTVSAWVMEQTGNGTLEFRKRIDPLLGSLVLFAVPSFLLATIGPCAIRALTRRVEESGRMSGGVFALGSLGSIAGVLITSFWLIAVLGIAANLRSIGVVSIVLGVTASFLRSR
jgi:MFS family permease